MIDDGCWTKAAGHGRCRIVLRSGKATRVMVVVAVEWRVGDAAWKDD